MDLRQFNITFGAAAAGISDNSKNLHNVGKNIYFRFDGCKLYLEMGGFSLIDTPWDFINQVPTFTVGGDKPSLFSFQLNISTDRTKSFAAQTRVARVMGMKDKYETFDGVPIVEGVAPLFFWQADSPSGYEVFDKIETDN